MLEPGARGRLANGLWARRKFAVKPEKLPKVV